MESLRMRKRGMNEKKRRRKNVPNTMPGPVNKVFLYQLDELAQHIISLST